MTVNRIGRVRTTTAQKAAQQGHSIRMSMALNDQFADMRRAEGIKRSDAEKAERRTLIDLFPVGREARYKEGKKRVGKIIGHDVKLGIIEVRYRPGAKILTYHPNAIELIPLE